MSCATVGDLVRALQEFELDAPLRFDVDVVMNEGVVGVESEVSHWLDMDWPSVVQALRMAAASNRKMAGEDDLIRKIMIESAESWDRKADEVREFMVRAK
jgi:hypothetical protein